MSNFLATHQLIFLTSFFMMIGMRFICLLCVVVLSTPLLSQNTDLLNWTPDEILLRSIMKDEFLRRIEKKIESEYNKNHLKFDFNTERAFQRIQPLLQNQSGALGDPASQLKSLVHGGNKAEEIIDFQREADLFALGMSIEIRDTLLTEYREIRDYYFSLLHLQNDLPSIPTPDNRDIRKAVKKNELPLSVLSRLKNWNAPLPDPKSRSLYDEFDRIKHFITGKHADRNQMPVYQLIDRYRSEYPALNDLLVQSRIILDQYRNVAPVILQLIDPGQKK